MRDSRVFVFTHDGVEHAQVSAPSVRVTIPSNNKPTENHTEYGSFPTPPTKGGTTGRSLWLIAKHEYGRTEVFTIHSGSDRETLPIFSHEEEAKMFLRLSTPGAGWRTRETKVGEVVSLLCGSWADVGKVALDPLPLFGDAAMAGLVSLSREDFVCNLMDEREPRVPHRGSFEPEAPTDFESSASFGRRTV